MTTDLESIRTAHEAVFGDSACPAWARDSLDRYTDHGVPTGDFLRAVLANDLMAAASRADVDSGRALAAIVGYVYRHVPSTSHGSYETVDAWLLMHQERRADGEALRAVMDEQLATRIQQARFERGKMDAQQGEPPTEASPEYQKGYEEGKRCR